VSNPWFRMYSEFSHDSKVQMLSEVMQRRYIMLMCLRCSNTLVTLHEAEVAFHLRISDADMAETKDLFVKKGFIDKDFNLLNWEKRQFASDTSNARVAKHRALQKEKQTTEVKNDATLHSQASNGLDTDADTNTDKRKDKEPVKADPLFSEFWETYPNTDRKQSMGKCLVAWKKSKAETYASVVIGHVERLKKSADWLKNNGEFIPAPLVYLNQRRWEGAEKTVVQNDEFAGAL
jgi:glutaredoxin